MPPTPTPKRCAATPGTWTNGAVLAIRDRGGLVGCNFYQSFLNDRPQEASREDVLRHAEYFLALGGEDTLAMGGDWDGAELPPDMPGLSAIPALYELFLRHYPEPVVEKLFYGNAARLSPDVWRDWGK